jgi:hypothetical protein
MEVEWETYFRVVTIATVIGSITVCWIVIHAYLRFAWNLPVARGKTHRQTALRSIGHALVGVSMSWFACKSLSWVTGTWTMARLGTGLLPNRHYGGVGPSMIVILGFVTPAFAWVLGRTGWRNDTVRVGYARATGVSLVTVFLLLLWLLFVVEQLPHEGCG